MRGGLKLHVTCRVDQRRIRTNLQGHGLRSGHKNPTDPKKKAFLETNGEDLFNKVGPLPVISRGP